jgi:hypothetical protein
MKTNILILIMITAMFSIVSCGDDDDNNNEANTLGVGAQCVDTEECDVENGQECLLDFKGGYCGISQCITDEECPQGSRCVAHDDGVNYCFLVCLDKDECNINRGVDFESNCSSSITFVEEPQDSKACVPPSN